MLLRKHLAPRLVGLSLLKLGHTKDRVVVKLGYTVESVVVEALEGGDALSDQVDLWCF